VAGFVGDEIPTVDPSDLDVEWYEMPTMRDLPTMRTLSQLAGEDVKALCFAEEMRKMMKKNSKGIRHPDPNLPFCISFVGFARFCWDGAD